MLCVFANSTIFVYTSGDPQHGWITYLVSGAGGMLLLAIYLTLYKKSGLQPLTAMLKNCLGKFAGSFLALLYAVFFLFTVSLSLNNYSTFLRYSSYFDTPQIFISAILCALSIYSLYKGLRVFARASEFFMWLILIVTIISIVVLTKYISWENIYPLKNIKIGPILADSVYPLILEFGMVVVFLTFFPYAGGYREIKKPLFISIGIVVTYISLIVLRTLLVLGNLIRRYTYPVFFAYSVSYPIKFEVFATTINGLSTLIKITVFLFASITILTEIFHAKFSRFIVPTVLIAGLSSLYLFKNIVESLDFLKGIWLYCSVVFEIFIPVILLIIYLIKNAINR